ncbi:hypothetical protein OLMES_1167 [Oleiphilus messinensis]|uniref:Microcin J25-processing protein McjB C-terminal domain-containing protein n=2 Tax=Oleiphilus messinensis TaxID=141451 RepID=A0A1Y0I4A9_9GAMM|nr:hypothetical protein OLMES_1167 [Oleiphilus messinensis]
MLATSKLGRAYTKYAALSWHEKRLLIEIGFLLACSWVAIRFVAFKRLTPHFGQRHHETAKVLTHTDPEAILIGRLIRAASDRLPWECKCLAQALVAQIMLSRRKIATTLYIGVTRDSDETRQHQAHAWVRYGEHYLTGGRGHKRYTVIDFYGTELTR